MGAGGRGGTIQTSFVPLISEEEEEVPAPVTNSCCQAQCLQ